MQLAGCEREGGSLQKKSKPVSSAPNRWEVPTMFACRRASLAMLIAVAASLAIPVPVQSAEPPHAPQVMGIQGVVGTVRQIDDRNIAVQVLINNTSENDAYIMMIGNLNASLSTGAIGYLADVSGVAWCRRSSIEHESISLCLKERGDNINIYSYVGSKESTDLTAHYRFDTGSIGGALKSGETISFTIKLMTRFSQGKGGVSSIGTPTAPRVLALNFPMIPIREK